MNYEDIVKLYNSNVITLNEARKLLNKLKGTDYPPLPHGDQLKSELEL